MINYELFMDTQKHDRYLARTGMATVSSRTPRDVYDTVAAFSMMIPKRTVARARCRVWSILLHGRAFWLELSLIVTYVVEAVGVRSAVVEVDLIDGVRVGTSPVHDVRPDNEQVGTRGNGRIGSTTSRVRFRDG